VHEQSKAYNNRNPVFRNQGLAHWKQYSTNIFRNGEASGSRDTIGTDAEQNTQIM
jgi:hypothetical protein